MSGVNLQTKTVHDNYVSQLRAMLDEPVAEGSNGNGQCCGVACNVCNAETNCGASCPANGQTQADQGERGGARRAP